MAYKQYAFDHKASWIVKYIYNPLFGGLENMFKLNFF